MAMQGWFSKLQNLSITRILPPTAEEDYRLVFAAGLVAAILLLRPSAMARVLGIAKIQYWYSEKNSLQLSLKDGRTTTFAQLCKEVMPPCRLNPFLFNGHLQTIYTIFSKRPCPIFYKRWTFENEDPTYTGQFSVDFVVTGQQPADEKVRVEGLPPRTTYYTQAEFDAIGSLDTKPMLVTLHGLSGGSHELYLREVLAKLIGKKGSGGEGGWEACVINSRGCSGTKITTNVLYNARATWDTRQTVKWLRRKFPNRPLFGCGFSLGANIIANYIGEEGSDCELKAAVLLSSPWNLEAGSLALQRTWIGLNVYSKAMGTSMKQLFERHVDQVSKNSNIDLEQVRGCKYLHEFDRYVQGPSWGYPTEGAYYRDASSVDALLGVRIPVLALNAEDDPVASHEALPREEIQQTPYGVLCTTTLGGHLSWFELGGERWFVTATEAYLQKMVRDVDLSRISAKLDVNTGGQITRPNRDPLRPVFEPARRKLHVPSS